MKEMKSEYFISDVESKRFNMNIIRGKSENIDIKNIQKQILNNVADILFLRIPSSNASQIPNLSKLGYEYFQTDTLVYYFVDFDKYQPKTLKNIDLKFKKATDIDKDLLKKMVAEIFSDYTNHYFSNPYIDKQGILEGYTEWVVSFINDETKEVFLIYRDDIAVAFATCSVEEGVAEGVLYGVMPSSSGGGIYSDIIRYTQNYYLQKGITKMKVSTQVQNYAVQKVWGREGFYMNESYATIHINSLLNYSCLPSREFDINIAEDHIIRCEDISKNYNIIHFDNKESKKCDFEEKIAPGLLSHREIIKILRTNFLETGAIFMSYKNIFLEPIYPNNQYKFVLTTPYCNNKKTYLCIVKVFDANANLVMLSYNHLIKK